MCINVEKYVQQFSLKLSKNRNKFFRCLYSNIPLTSVLDRNFVIVRFPRRRVIFSFAFDRSLFYERPTHVRVQQRNKKDISAVVEEDRRDATRCGRCQEI